MNREYSLTGTKIIMRRLFLHDTDEIVKCYSDYDKLFYNPVDHQFIKNIFLHGEFWGAFSRDRLIACCYFFPLDSAFFKNHNTFSLVEDFIPCPEKYMNMGYIGINADGKKFLKDFSNKEPAVSGLYQAFLNISEMQAFRRGFRYILHYVPLKLTEDFSHITACGYRLIKLRGLDKMVVHYIFEKSIFPLDKPDSEKSVTVSLPLTNTKELSRYLENGWWGYQLLNNSDDKTIFIKRLITD